MNKKYLAILGGGLKQNKNSQWVSTDITEPEDFQGAPSGEIRVIAASLLSKQNPELYIIATGGHGYDKNVRGKKHPGLANITQSELIKLGVPQNRIIKESKSNNTYQQLIELSKIIQQQDIKDIAIISSRWHLPRTKAMIGYLPQLKPLKKIKLISAEKICLKYYPKKWKKIIAQVYHSQAMKQRIKQEKRGIQDIKAGKYRLK
ncbi:hypothetical protein A3B87_00100 [Candidatus Kuenenbacteria bacterium RIFCSPHIGHO2_02_FULL_39_13]|uniref:DUF218 domain-containing protein n=1 Tax=Candidatus Kuenenbacteria bacterium RIFCSPHIGHO2_02_FULL_39_13 TaxID=1798561 RepID=A0A1F6FN13_9BACT|nr:MAG: hypothetical protein A3B87_00100 [Candidatus Kuenenbacteria bacterium RIFCSPHIGHO2_02_FULL_39_13]